MYSKDGLYNLFRTLSDMLRKPTNGKYKKFEEHDFEWFTKHYYSNTPNWNKGAECFIPLANAINSGRFSLISVCAAYIGNWILQDKPVTIKTLNTIDKIDNFTKFYSVLETQKHFQYIKEKEIESINIDDFDMLSGFYENKNNVYQVNEEQKNTLYEFIKEGKINFFCFIYAQMQHKFEIDENKITDPKYLTFIKCMSIVRQNITKK